MINERFTSDLALRGLYEAIDIPNVIMYVIGANDILNDVKDGVYEANMRAAIERDRRLLEELGEEDPLFLLVAPYETHTVPEKFILKAQALEEIAIEFKDVGFLNLYARAGGANSSEGHTASGYTHDGIHPTKNGADYFSQLIWNGLEEWVTPGDVNGDGLLNGLDIAETLSHWGPCIGHPASVPDYNQDGNVDAIDLAVVLGAFDSDEHRTTSTCPEDLNGDSVVGAADLAELLSSWQSIGNPADFNPCVSPGVGAEDLAQLLSVWGPCS